MKDKNFGLIGKDGYKSLDIAGDKELKNLFGIYGQVSRTVLKNKDLSHGAKFYFVVLRTFVFWDKTKVNCGKTVLSDTFLTNDTLVKNGYEANINITRQTVAKWRMELTKKGIVSVRFSNSGWIYTFNVEPDNDFEQITRNFILTDKLTLSEKQFIINVMPYVFGDKDIIAMNNSQIAEATGYSYNTVKNNMNSLEEKGIIRDLKTRRAFNLTYIMTGIIDNYIDAIRRIQELENKLSEKDKELEERDKLIAHLKIEAESYKLRLQENFSDKEIKMIEEDKVLIFPMTEEDNQKSYSVSNYYIPPTEVDEGDFQELRELYGYDD